jgi:adenosylmethionine---8-amino-7-oxononanoate aminotransferase
MSSLSDKDKSNIWHPFTPLEDADQPILITSAEGVYLHTADGRKIIDAVSSWWVNLHGHSNPHIADAISKQAHRLEHVIFAGFTHEPAIKLSENLLSILPSNQSKIFFSDDGSTAVEVGLKMAFQFWANQGIKKTNVIALDGAYHGDTFGSMSVGERGLFTSAFSPYLFDVSFLDFPFAGKEDYVYNQFMVMADDPKTGTFVFEPLIQGAAGMRTYSADLLDRMIAYAQSKNIVCIADEVFTGFGRTGKMFASDHLMNKPDIVAVSKGITGGTLPLGVTSCSERVLAPFKTSDTTKTFYHGHSYTANPLACAAANASFELLTDPACQKNIARISEQQSNFVKNLNHPRIKNARTLGTIMSLELNSNESTSYTNSTRKTIYDFFLRNDILMRPLGNVLYVLPPYVITHDELEHVHQTIYRFLAELK